MILFWYPYNSGQVFRMISEQAPVYARISLFEPSTVGCDFRSQSCQVFFIVLVLCVLILHLILGTICVIFYLIYIRQNLHIEKTMSHKTWTLNQQLFKALMMQLAVFGVFLTLPCSSVAVFFIGSNIFYSNVWNMVAQLAFVLLSLYPIGETIILLYFIKPYRHFVQSLIRQVLEHLNLHSRARLFHRNANNNSGFSISHNQVVA